MRVYEIIPVDQLDESLELGEDFKSIKNKAIGALTAGSIAAGIAGWHNQSEPEPAPQAPTVAMQAPEPEKELSPKDKMLQALQSFGDNQEKMVLALTMWGEARNHGEDGMRAVGHVIKNRAEANMRKFGGGTIADVALKAKQFSAWNENDPNLEAMMNVKNLSKGSPDHKMWQKANQIADEILSGRSKDPTKGAVYYHTTSVKPYWAKKLKPIRKVANHVFYRDNTKNQDMV